MEGWRRNRGTYLTFNNVAHLAGLVLDFGKKKEKEEKENTSAHNWPIAAISTPMQSCSTHNPPLRRLQKLPSIPPLSLSSNNR